MTADLSEAAEIKNRRIVLVRRPIGMPSLADFRMEAAELPEVADGEVLLRTLALSLDPYMRGRMNEAASYAPSVALGEVMVGATISQVVASRHARFKVGEWVLANAGWQDYAISDGTGLSVLSPEVQPATQALGVLGMPGFTAYVGLLDIGLPQAGETVVVAAATGAVGSVVGQIAKLKGCRVVGVAGGAEKCRYAIETLGFDACMDHYEDSFANNLAAACATGIDIYFENVGGAVLEAVLPLLNIGARVPVCGLIAWSSLDGVVAGPDMSPALMRTLIVKRARMQGFLIFDHYAQRYKDFLSDMRVWLKDGQVKAREDVVDGLEHAPSAFIGLLRGDNFGKLLIRVSEM